MPKAEFRGSINLQALPATKRLMLEGREHICIPIGEDSLIAPSDRGAFLNFFCYQRKSINEWGQTHYITPEIPKRMDGEKYTIEELRTLAPICGNLKKMSLESSPVVGQPAAPAGMPANRAFVADAVTVLGDNSADDMPF